MKTMAVLMGSVWAAGVVAQAATTTPESFLIDAAKQVPALGVLAWLVYVTNKERRETDNTVKSMGAMCHEFHAKMLERTQAALDRNTEMLGRLEAALARVRPEGGSGS